MFKYLVTTKEGGLMEDPVVRHTNAEVIVAETEEEASDIYNYRNSTYYFYGSIDECLGATKEPKTEKVILDEHKEESRRRWKGIK